MNSPEFEAFLARLYTENDLRQQFLVNPAETARAAGLTNAQCVALAAIDREGLETASLSYAAKRKKSLRLNKRGKFTKWYAAVYDAIWSKR